MNTVCKILCCIPECFKAYTISIGNHTLRIGFNKREGKKIGKFLKATFTLQKGFLFFFTKRDVLLDA